MEKRSGSYPRSSAVTGRLTRDRWTRWTDGRFPLLFFHFVLDFSSVPFYVHCAADPLPPFSFWGCLPLVQLSPLE
jgi:hypothetical protein